MTTTHQSRPVSVIAERWDPDGPTPAWVCPHRGNHGDRRRSHRQVNVDMPHIHRTPKKRNWLFDFVFVRPGDWLVRGEDGSFIAVLDDETFRATYEPTAETDDNERNAA